MSPVLAASGAGDRRESWRQFLHSTIQPVSELIVDELRIKLDTPELRFDFSELMASDLAGRARALGSMVQAGIKLGKAPALSGLLSERGET